jgi:hypothetical protein
VAATDPIWLEPDLVARPDRALHCRRGQRGRVRDPADDPRPDPEDDWVRHRAGWRRRSGDATACGRSGGRRDHGRRGGLRGSDQSEYGNARKYQSLHPQNWSLSSAVGVSCRAGAKRACASGGFTAGLAPGIHVGPPLREHGARGLGVAAIYRFTRPQVSGGPDPSSARDQGGR